MFTLQIKHIEMSFSKLFLTLIISLLDYVTKCPLLRIY